MNAIENRKAQAAIPGDLEATSRAVQAAAEAHVLKAITTSQWERRGLLQRLTRLDRPAAPMSSASERRPLRPGEAESQAA